MVVLDRVSVPRLGPRRPRTKPRKVRADRANGFRANRAYLRRRAQLMQADEDTVRDVIHRFDEIGLACLDPQWAGGRPRRLSPDDEDFVRGDGHHPSDQARPALRSWAYAAVQLPGVVRVSADVGESSGWGLLTWVHPSGLVDRVVAACGRAEQRRRLLPARLAVYVMLALALFSPAPYLEVMRHLVEGLRGQGLLGE